jgi:hypothetical protein
MFWPAVTGDWRAWLWLAACGVGGTAAGVSLSWGHGKAGTVLLTVGAAVGGIVVGLLAIFAVLWVTAPHRLLRARVERLEIQVAELPASSGVVGDEEQVRVALFAVRSELGACATRIIEAEEDEKWWDPDIDPLPATQWDRHFAVLTRLPDKLNAQIDVTYKTCDRLNHLARWYLEELRRKTIFPTMPKPSPTVLNDYDKEKLAEGRKKIDQTNNAISAHLGASAPVATPRS